MARTIVSLPLDTETAREVAAQARKQGKSRTEYLRDIVSGHLRVAKFRALREAVQDAWKPSWPATEEEVVSLIKAERRRSKGARI